jgi:lysophospholipase L1-like esterase
MSPRHLLALLALPLATCAGSPPTSAPGIEFVVFVDDDGDGRLGAAEIARVPGVALVANGERWVSGSDGRATLRAAPGTPLGIDPATLPPYHRAPAALVAGSAPLAVPLALPIGSNRPGVYLAFGDSITEGHNFEGDAAYLPFLEAKLRERFGRATLVNRGVGSQKSDQGAARIEATLAEVRPAFTLVMLGTNDWTKKPCNRVEKLETTCFTLPSLRAIVAAVRAAGSLPVLATVPPVNVGASALTPPQRRDWVEAVNQRLRAWARAERLPLADTEAAFARDGGGAALFFDHLHPSARGQQRIADAFYEALVIPLR